MMSWPSFGRYVCFALHRCDSVWVSITSSPFRLAQWLNCLTPEDMDMLEGLISAIVECQAVQTAGKDDVRDVGSGEHCAVRTNLPPHGTARATVVSPTWCERRS